MSITEQRLRSGSVTEAEQLDESGELGELAPIVRGRDVRTGRTYAVRSPYDDTVVAAVDRAGPDEIEQAIAAAAPELEGVEAEGAAEPAPQLLQIGSLQCPTELVQR